MFKINLATVTGYEIRILIKSYMDKIVGKEKDIGTKLPQTILTLLKKISLFTIRY